MRDLAINGPRYIKLHPLPHEFGLRVNVVNTAFSALWIAGWEIGNVVRMKSKALMEGRIPISSNVSVSFQFMGASLVGVGGKSEVSSINADFGKNIKTSTSNKADDGNNGNKLPFSPYSEKSSPTEKPYSKSPLEPPKSFNFYPSDSKGTGENQKSGDDFKEPSKNNEFGREDSDYSPDNTSRLTLQTEFFSILTLISFSDNGFTPHEGFRFGETRSINNSTRSEKREELIRNFLLFVSGMISESEFKRKLDEIKRELNTGNFISTYA